MFLRKNIDDQTTGTYKLQYFENSSWQVLQTILKLPLLILILKFRKIYHSVLKYQYMIPSLIGPVLSEYFSQIKHFDTCFIL